MRGVLAIQTRYEKLGAYVSEDKTAAQYTAQIHSRDHRDTVSWQN